ncbi:MAG: hypothetical protein Q9182_006809, partial [Xanthomendoza sp. 2 TL-2023]
MINQGAQGNFTLPSEGYTIQIADTPLSVVFSRYSGPVPLPALRSLYKNVRAVAISRGQAQIRSSEHWVLEATLNIYPRARFYMTWTDLSYVTLALEQFAQEQIGFRFDVFLRGKGEVAIG